MHGEYRSTDEGDPSGDTRGSLEEIRRIRVEHDNRTITMNVSIDYERDQLIVQKEWFDGPTDLFYRIDRLETAARVKRVTDNVEDWRVEGSTYIQEHIKMLVDEARVTVGNDDEWARIAGETEETH